VVRARLEVESVWSKSIHLLVLAVSPRTETVEGAVPACSRTTTARAGCLIARAEGRENIE